MNTPITYTITFPGLIILALAVNAPMFIIASFTAWYVCMFGLYLALDGWDDIKAFYWTCFKWGCLLVYILMFCHAGYRYFTGT